MKEIDMIKELPVTNIADDIYLINEFDGTNCYLVVGTKKALLIDCGTGFCDLKSEYIAAVIKWGEEIIEKNKNSLIPKTKRYPNQSDGIIYKTNRIHSKLRCTSSIEKKHIFQHDKITQKLYIIQKIYATKRN